MSGGLFKKLERTSELLSEKATTIPEELLYSSEILLKTSENFGSVL